MEPDSFALWRNQPAWQILDTDWEAGSRFLSRWAAWKADPDRPRMLHYVALCNSLTEAPPDCTAALPAVAPPTLAQILTAQTRYLEVGFNRLVFEHGHVLLTLCVGELKAMLRAQSFLADEISLPRFDADIWDRWALQALVRTCRRGTLLTVDKAEPGTLEVFSNHGFDRQPGGDSTPLTPLTPLQVCFNPRWQPKASRRHFANALLPPTHCVVIGAGLAGAGTAASLARRGWDVLVLGAGAAPADGASGLPVGLMMPQPSADDSMRTRLLRSGLSMTRQQADQFLVNDEDWSDSGVMSLKPNEPPLWLPSGAWVKPGRLVHAWLSQPGVRFHGTSQVASIQRVANEWILRDAAQTVLAQASLVVIACAGGSVALLAENRLQLRSPLVGFHGQVSWAPQRSSDLRDLPLIAVNGHGTFVPHVPSTNGPTWCAGATFTPDTLPQLTIQQAHQANLARLAKLLPDTAEALADQFEAGAVKAWQNTRSSTLDRLPLVGLLNDRKDAPNQAMLCINTGYGSRGLSWSVLCAELLAAQLGGEPYPIEASLARALDCFRNTPRQGN